MEGHLKTNLPSCKKNYATGIKMTSYQSCTDVHRNVYQNVHKIANSADNGQNQVINATWLHYSCRVYY